PADPAGLNTWLNLLSQGGSLLQVEAGILGSDEYLTTRGGGTVNGFLQALFEDTLHRPIDATGSQAFTQALTVGIPTTASTIGSTTAAQAVTTITAAGTPAVSSTVTSAPFAGTTIMNVGTATRPLARNPPFALGSWLRS